MKKLIIAVLASFLTLSTMAESISREQAQLRVEQFLKDMYTRQAAAEAQIKGFTSTPQVTKLESLTPVQRSRMQARHMAPNNTNDLYYVFDRGEDEGFVIASGDDRTEPVLGYCDHGHFDYANLPDAMKEWLEGYAAELEYLQRAPQARAAGALPTHPAIGMMLTTQWNQGSPYNYYSPEFFNQGKSVTGCVATAMAQLLYYNRAKSTDVTLADIPSWDGGTKDPETGNVLHNEGVKAGSVIDWANCRDKYTGNETEKQKQAVGWLMYVCGAAVKMNFTNSGSGAVSSRVADGSKAYFGYRDDCRMIWRSNYSAVDFDAVIYDQLAHDLPMYMAGGGHAYCCDGYDGNRYYHINWGWGGSSDGYYLLAKLTPGEEGIGGNGGFGYSSGLGAIINMEPASYGDKAMLFADATVKSLCVANWDTNGDGELSFDEAAAVKDIGTVFKDSRIRKFNELHDFTSLQSVSDDAFSGCTMLNTLRLPESVTSIGARAFYSCRGLTELQMPQGIQSIGEEAFSGCRTLKEINLQEGITVIEPRTFQNCVAIKVITLHPGIMRIGDQAFANCTKLMTVTVEHPNPQDIQMGENVFEGITLALATLNALQGTRDFFESTAPWSDFGKMNLIRSIGEDRYTSLQPGKIIYLWNVGKQSYVAQGEYNNSQNVLSEEPMKFIIYEGEDEYEGLYCLYSPDVITAYKYTGRGNSNSVIGQDVRYTYINGALTKKSYWTIREVSEGVYTFQVPEGFEDYDANLYWGVQFDHQNGYIEEGGSTMATYYDIPYEGHEKDCQWMFVDYNATYGAYQAALELEELLEKAEKEGLDVARERRIHENLSSTYEDLLAAQQSVRRKLGIIFSDEPTIMDICLNNWDIDGDGEFSQKEAEMITDISKKFTNLNKAQNFDIIQYFSGLTEIPAEAFNGCLLMNNIILPQGIGAIQSKAFKNCKKLTDIIIPEYVKTIAASAFEGCNLLRTVRIENPEPEYIDVDAYAFKGLVLSRMTLEVPIGTRERYAALNVWKKFGNIVEVRTRTYPKYSPIQLNTDGYIYHVGTRRFLCGGEAYGTQAVVGPKGYVYQFRRQSAMGEGVYYLTSNDTPNNNHLFFRSKDDSNVGKGIKSCFIDGANSRLSDKNAWWQTTPVADTDNLFTFQVPKVVSADYTAGEYLGIQTDHATDAVDDGITYGTYWDIPYKGHERDCQWAFITVEDMEEAARLDDNISQLLSLMKIANEKGITTDAEQAVYDDFNATSKQVEQAARGLRDKLHFINFDCPEAKALCIENWDTDNDGEFSYDEAAAVKELSTIFKGNTTITSLNELQYFTSLTEIPTSTFRGTSLISIYLPASVTTIKDGAFSNSSKLKYVVLLNEKAAVSATASLGLSKTSATFFVPKALLSTYQADEFWSAYNVTEYTGIPTVVPNDSERLYGRSNSRFYYSVEGAPINGDPTLSCEADATSPVGEYPIIAEAGTITSQGLVLRTGTLTVQPSTLTVTARSYKREIGEENPTFEYDIKGFRNQQNADVLTTLPTITCDATKDSPWGEYEIRVSGAEAPNYIFEYVSGKLTINPPVGISDLTAEQLRQPVYDLSGRLMRRNLQTDSATPLPPGIYIIAGRRIAIR